MLQNPADLSGKTLKEAIEELESCIRVNNEQLEYILTHLDSSNITEIDTSKTKIYEGGENEL